jgi:integrase
VFRYYEDVVLPDGSPGRIRKSVILGPVSEVGAKKDAWRLADEIVGETNHGRQRPQSSMVFEKLGQQWKDKILPLKKASTQGFYEGIMKNHLLPAFKDKRLCDLSRAEIQGFITERIRKYSWNTVQGMRVTLHQLLEQAVEWGYLKDNPAGRIKMPRRPPRKENFVLSQDEARKLVAQMPEGKYRCLVGTAAATGLRRCELFVLERRDVDLDKRVIHVRRRVYRGQVDSPKSRRSIREVPIPDWLVEQLGQRLEETDAGENSPLFPGPNGKPLSATTAARKVLHPALEKLELPRFSWQCFRRSLATWLIEAGVPIKTVQELLGHASATTTLEFYVESRWESRRQAIDDVGRILDPNGPKSARVVRMVAS